MKKYRVLAINTAPNGARVEPGDIIELDEHHAVMWLSYQWCEEIVAPKKVRKVSTKKLKQPKGE